MTSISVVQYTPVSPHKINVLQQNNHSGNKREVIVLRKPQHILPQPEEYDKDNILGSNNTKKKTKSNGKTNPQPVAVARRNARQRNRVKQVNNGFANLRQHIPNFIAQAFETNNGRGGNKKLSKVETLRMAVEYIRSLEDLLAMDDCDNNRSPSIQNPVQYNYPVLSPSEDGFDEDDISLTQTPPPQQQYIKINTSNNTYEIIPANLYENSENMDPLILTNHQLINDAALIDTNIDYSMNQDLSYLNNIHTSASLSPGMYSDQSLSPNSLELSDQKSFIPVFNSPSQDDIKLRLSPHMQIKTEDVLPVISLKTESEVPDQHKENVIDVIQWWEQQQPPTSRRS